MFCFVFFLKPSLSLSPTLEWRSWLTATSASLVQAILSPQPPEYLGLPSARHHALLIFVFFVGMGFAMLARMVSKTPDLR